MTSSGRPNSKSAADRSSIARARSSTSRATSAAANSSLANSAYGDPRHNPSASSNAPQRDLRLVQTPRARPAPAPRNATRRPRRSPPAADIPVGVSPGGRHRASRAAVTPRSGACASRSAAARHPTERRRDDHSRPPRWRGPPTPRASGAAAALPSRTRSPSRTTSSGPSTHSAVATRSSTGPPTPPTLRTQLRSSRDPAAIALRDLSLTLWSRKTSSHRPVWKRDRIVEAVRPQAPTAVDNQRRKS